MEKAKKIAAVLPAGKYFEQVYLTALVPWAEFLGSSISRINLEAANVGAICNELENADLVVADISARNPRVMYAAGYAHGIGKRVLFITQFAEDFPFPLTNQQVIITYSGNAEYLRGELEALGSARAENAAPAADAREKFLGLFGDILRTHRHEHRGPVEMENPGTFVLRDQDMELALVQDLSRKARELGVRLKLM